MSIIKNINNVKPFETIPRKLLQQCDKKRSHTESKPLSLQAIGLLCNLQSYPENWEIHKTELYNRYEKNGRRQIQNAWNELVDANYIVQFKIYDGNKLDYYYYFSTEEITEEQIKELEDFHHSEKLDRFELKDKNPTVQNEQYDNDGEFSTVHSVQYNLYSTDVNSTKRTDNIIHNQYNTHKQNTHEYTTHNPKTTKNKPSGSSQHQKLLKMVKKEFNIQITESYEKQLTSLFNYFDQDIIEYAIDYASVYGNKPKVLLLSVLEKWKDADIQTLDEAKAFKVTQTNVVNFSREKTPKWLENRKSHDEYIEDDKDDDTDDPEFIKMRDEFYKQLEKEWGE